MTALCGGGTSSVRSGVSPVIILTTTAVEAFLTPLIDPVAATIISGVIAASLTIDANAFCSTDPPADPGLTSQDLLDIANTGDPGAIIQATPRILQWFGSQYWSTICKCDTGSTPAPAAPSNPGPVSINPGLPAQNTPCWNVTIPFAIPARVSGTVGTTQVLTSQGLPVTQNSSTYNAGAFVSPSSWLAYASVPGATKIRMTATLNEVPTSNGVEWQLFGLNSSNALVAGAQLQLNAQTGTPEFVWGTATVIDTLPAAAIWWGLAVTNLDAGVHNGTVTVSFFCPPGVQIGPACCPPDPSMQELLRQILSLEQAIYSIIPVRVPNYSGGAAHAGLTGDGTVVLAATTIAIQTNVTTLPAVYGEITGTPFTYFDVGWITPVTNHGPTAGIRISRGLQAIQLPEATISVDYSLPPGEVLTITELLAG